MTPGRKIKYKKPKTLTEEMAGKRLNFSRFVGKFKYLQTVEVQASSTRIKTANT